MRNEDYIFAYSDVHAREIHLSGNPLPYIEALEAIGACHLPAVEVIEDISTRMASLSPNSVRKVIPETIDAGLKAGFALEETIRLIAPLLSAGQRISIEGEIETVSGLLEAYIEDIERDLMEIDPSGLEIAPLLSQLKQLKCASLAEIRSLAGTKLQQEARGAQEELARKLRNVNLDDIPVEEVAAFVMDKLPEGDPTYALYPEGFGRGTLTSGTVTSFAFLLFTLGVGALKRPMKGGSERFIQRLKNQMRDCEHIEQAIRCQGFFTGDDGAARLAKAVYCYAGVPIDVGVLKIIQEA